MLQRLLLQPKSRLSPRRPVRHRWRQALPRRLPPHLKRACMAHGRSIEVGSCARRSRARFPRAAPKAPPAPPAPAATAVPRQPSLLLRSATRPASISPRCLASSGTISKPDVANRRRSRDSLQPRHRLPRNGTARRSHRRIAEGLPVRSIADIRSRRSCRLTPGWRSASWKKAFPKPPSAGTKRLLLCPTIDGETRVALNYELAGAYETAGDKPSALKHFMEVYGSNIDYRDVAERIKALKS